VISAPPLAGPPGRSARSHPRGHAAHDIHALRDRMEVWRDARRTAWIRIIKVAVTELLAALPVGTDIKLRLTGDG